MPNYNTIVDNKISGQTIFALYLIYCEMQRFICMPHLSLGEAQFLLSKPKAGLFRFCKEEQSALKNFSNCSGINI